MKKSTLRSLGIAFALLLTGCTGGGGNDNPPEEKNDGTLEKPFTVVDVINECDEAGANVVVGTECYVTGTFETGTTIDSYGRWSGVAKMDGKELKLESLTVPSTMNIAPENGRLDGKKFIVKGYAELYNGNYVIGYLNATLSPTGAKYNPTIYSIEGKTDYENIAGYKSEINKFVDQFVAGSNVEIPALPDAEYQAVIDINKWGPGFSFTAKCADKAEAGEPESLEEIYKATVEAANWVNTNDEEYTYDDYGYYYQDPGENYEVQFYTWDGAFYFYITDLKLNYSSGKYCVLGSDTDENWYDYYVEEYGYEYSETLPTEEIAELCGIDEEDVPAFSVPYGCTWAYEEADEDYPACIEVDLFGWDIEAGLKLLSTDFDLGYTIFYDYICFAKDRSYVFEFVESYSDDFGYILYFYNIDDYCCTSLTENTAWTAEDIEIISAVTGAENVIPFMKFGSDYEFYSYGTTLYLFDSYCYDLTESYIEVLEAANYEETTLYDDLYEEYYTVYEKECADGTIIDIDLYWSTGNVVEINVTRSASEIVLVKTEVSIKQGKTYQIEYSFGPTGCVEPTDEVTFASDNPAVTVSETGLVTVSETATVGDTAKITVTCGTLSAKLIVTVEEAGAATDTKVDVISNTKAEATMGYEDRKFVGPTTGIEYTTHFYCAKGDSTMQFKSKNACSGLVNATTIGDVASITVDFKTAASGFEVYASNSPITIADMYSGSLTQVGTITSTTTTYTFENSYAFFGIRSVNGAVIVNSISVSWNA